MALGGTVVEHLTHNPRVEGSNFYSGTGKEKIIKNFFVKRHQVAKWLYSRLIILRPMGQISPLAPAEWKNYFVYWLWYGSTVVEHSYHNPKIEGLNPIVALTDIK